MDALRLTYLVHWVGLPVRPNSMCVTYALPACCNPSNLLRPMAPILNCCVPSPARTYSSSTTGCVTRSLAPRPKTCSKSSTTVMAVRLPWSPPRSRSANGTPASPTPPSPIRSSIVLSTMPTGSIYQEILCEKSIPP
jgi:hypothetical protein